MFLVRDLQEFQFVIPGACPPKGSRVPVGRGRATRESSKRVAPWTDEAKRAMRDRLGKPLATFSGPVYVVPTFVLQRPKVTESAHPVAITIGDLDKLVRCLLDAMTKAGVIEDDRFVVDLGDDNGGRPRKVWGDYDHTIVRVGRMLTGDEPGGFLPLTPSRQEMHRERAERMVREAEAALIKRIAQNPYA